MTTTFHWDFFPSTILPEVSYVDISVGDKAGQHACYHIAIGLEIVQ